jgi:hypothetical protein
LSYRSSNTSALNPKRSFIFKKMAEGKKSILIYSDWKHTFEALTDVEAGQLIKHLLAYVNDENPKTDNRIVQIAFEPMKQHLKRDLVKYEEIKGKRSEAGKISAEKKKQNSTNATHVESVQQTSTNSTVNVNVNDIRKNIKKDFSDEIVKLGQYVFKDDFSVQRAITTYSTSLTNLKESFLNFLMSEKYHEKELDELAMSKISKHFFRWLLTHQPEKVSKDYNALMEGKHGEDYYVSLTPVSEDRIEEMIKEGWVQTPQGMVKRLKK